MKTNVKNRHAPKTHEGAVSVQSSPVKELRRAVMACMLFEDQFYESGEDSSKRIAGLVKMVSFEESASIAIEARERMKLRHAPLFIVRELLRYHHGRQVGDLIARVIQRPDECTELLALYWKDDPKQPLTAQMKIGLARALKKFSAYQIAKWNRDGDVKLRDVLFLSHARPTNEEQAELFKKLASNTLDTPDTWEVALSGGADKKATFTRLIQEKKLGGLALLRNLRNMVEARVSDDVLRQGLAEMKTDRILPFRFISAAKYAPALEDAIEAAMFQCLANIEKLGGKTALLIDHSGSMHTAVSAKSEISRFDAAGALAVILRELCERCAVFTFAARTVQIPPRRGFAMLQAVREVVDPVGTLLGKAVRHVYSSFPGCDRIIVITDEQSADRPPQPQGRGYIVNVGGHQNGIAYGPWISIDGWSEHIIDYIREFEAERP